MLSKRVLGGFEDLARHQFPSNLGILEQVLLWFDSLYPEKCPNKSYSPHIPSLVWQQCKLALVEGFTNAVRHAHKNYDREIPPVEIEVKLLSEYLELRIWDRGKAFNLQETLEKRVQEVDNQTEGGRGLILLDKMADKLSYEPVETGRNCLLFIKYYQPQQQLN
ncbi:ATP-binding protein [Merismopedia glauca]|uniref:Anti-sigma regulatory factor n=1 Tax=Merismopedia glauca CCAP 1448/3 TaxID=1296344 RepID=A0A2T1C313_9CYAN|nr:ATP-binding protein [Merismopedia glauca]PSB02665.1 anti-sigma regulatory factor [Merismopedia glauca CCAP 1448/3]